MKYLAVALVMVALIAADFGATALGFPAHDQSAWAAADTISLILGSCGIAYMVTRDEADKDG